MLRRCYRSIFSPKFTSPISFKIKSMSTDIYSREKLPDSIIPIKCETLPETKHRNIMEIIKEEGYARQPDNRARLFVKCKTRKLANILKPGDVVNVESYVSKTTEKTSSFAGVCISIKRQGIDTNFTLRNIILKVGVEQRFSAFSPMIKSIKILHKTEKRFRRAKLYYLREQPGKAFQISAFIRQNKLNE
ncbi:8784_t:CDS:2 [Entrophospora sp. SA101]|nr:6203_t:CDS:2 [Entrophospora candida]CAJ0753379.1 23004_t:CDS:2 [Entrophospora sp. SA101]CAG8452578.1 10359_t:CDS:2 [Entrophospora candida]CAJ0768743.1 8784_t:CDS:2 [Entrophospora sp. SA101]CAJ0832323.1 17836_t:CDS:2 [Entrophospora sp. SA101]